MDVQLKKGLLDVCVLAALYREESYGYKIVSDLGPRIGISESTLYPILRRLEQSACLTTREAAHNGRLRKYYAITPQGERRLAQERETWKVFSASVDRVIGGERHACV